MTFHVGQKVVCVGIGSFAQPFPWPAHIVVGGVYTIRDVDARFDDALMIRLEEYVGPVIQCTGLIVGPYEVCFRSTHFRPAVEKKTDISIFTALLTRSQQKRKLKSPVTEDA